MSLKKKCAVILRKANTFAATKGLLSFLSDEKFLKMRYKLCVGRSLDLNDPQTFNEKIQWLKIYNRSPGHVAMVDKILAKEYVAEIIGDEYVIPTLAVWAKAEDIDFDSLPDQFVLKCTHNSGFGTCICRDKAALNIPQAKENLREGLAQDYYRTSREWPYKNVPRRIVGEKFMVETSAADPHKALTDYKVFTFNGEPKLIYVYQSAHTPQGGKPVNTYCDVFDLEWNLMPIQQNFGNDPVTPAKPVHLDEMLELSRTLSSGIPFLRVDFYEINGKVYVGEMTFYSWAGFEPFHPEEWDDILGSWLKLPQKQRLHL